MAEQLTLNQLVGSSSLPRLTSTPSRASARPRDPSAPAGEPRRSVSRPPACGYTPVARLVHRSRREAMQGGTLDPGRRDVRGDPAQPHREVRTVRAPPTSRFMGRGPKLVEADVLRSTAGRARWHPQCSRPVCALGPGASGHHRKRGPDLSTGDDGTGGRDRGRQTGSRPLVGAHRHDQRTASSSARRRCLGNLAGNLSTVPTRDTVGIAVVRCP